MPNPIRDVEARNKMVLEHKGLAIQMARRYRGRGLELLDLISEGIIGLIRAADHYDESHGVKFSSYACYRIKEAIVTAIRRTGHTIRIPVRTGRRLPPWFNLMERITRETGREPTFHELADILGLSRKTRRVLWDGIQAWKFDDPDHLEVQVTLDPNPLEAEDERQRLIAALRSLDPFTQDIIAMRFGLFGTEPMTSDQVGHVLGRSGQRIRFHTRRALKSLAYRLGPPP